MSQLSIILLHLGETDLFEQTLVSVLQNQPVDCEIIVPQFNYDDPYDLGAEVRFVEVSRKASLTKQFAQAIDKTDSDIIHLLTPGVEVAEGWCDWSVAHFQDPYIGCVSPIVLDEEGEIISCGLNSDLFLRSKNVTGDKNDPVKLKRLNPIGPTSVAGFYRRSALLQIGDIAKFGSATFDLEIALALRAIGFVSKLEIDCRIKRIEELVAASALQTGIEMQKTIWRFGGFDGLLKAMIYFAGVNLVELTTALFRPSNLLRVFGRTIALKDLIQLSKFSKTLGEARGPELEGQKLQSSQTDILNIAPDETVDARKSQRSTRRAA